MESSHTSQACPLISVLVPTHGRPDRINALIACLSGQTTAADSFEVIIVDDGGDPPVALDVRQLPMRCTVVQRRGAGPAAARNAGLALVAAPLVLILNDDAVPAANLIERHLSAHRDLDPAVAQQTAVLGTFHFTDESRRSPFVQVLDATDRLFSFTSLKHGQRHDWTYFWTCNISLPVAAVFGVGGFDEEHFDRAICEDVELGLRLQRTGLGVLFDERCVAYHEHQITPQDYAARAVQLGVYGRRIQALHGEPETNQPQATAKLKATILDGFAERLKGADAYFSSLEVREERSTGEVLGSDEIREIEAELAKWSEVYRQAGVYRELTGVDLPALCRSGASQATAVAAVIVSFNALANTERCVGALRAAADPRCPLSIVVVDNGSTDGSAEWIRAQPDIQAILNPTNYGAPRARNQGLGLVGERTDWIAFFDNDVFVPRGWMERALFHGEADPEVGSIALCANRASKGQVLPYNGSAEQAAIDAFALEHAQRSPRTGADCTLFTSLAVLVRADVMQRIGGFDESFSPWGFEDDDLALRIRLAGWRNRVAKDTFVFHAAYDGPAKQQRHSAWLHQNWEAFLQKWSPGALGAELFDYSRVTLPQLGEATEAQLYAALPGTDAEPPTWAGQELPHGEVEPELTVLICTYQRRETLLRSLASFEDQTAIGRYEIVVVNNGSTDGTREALDGLQPKVPLRIVHLENGGLSAARNAGLQLARGAYVLFANDDTIAAPDNVEQHLLAHRGHGPKKAILGTLERPPKALDNALMRVIEETTLVFGYAGLDANSVHDWNRFWTGNLSVSSADVRCAGGFDESFVEYGCEDTDLGYRLQSECGTGVVYAPAVRAEHERTMTFEDLANHSRQRSSAFVRFFHKHPETLSHPDWQMRSTTSLSAKETMLAKTQPDRRRAEALAKELSAIDVGTLERAGYEGANVSQSIQDTLKAYLGELNHLWWAMGEVEAIRSGVGKDAVARARAEAETQAAELVAG